MKSSEFFEKDFNAANSCGLNGIRVITKLLAGTGILGGIPDSTE